MTDLGSALRHGIERLSAANVDTPRLDAELLLAHALGLTRTQLHARLHDPLPPSNWLAFQAALERRADREPLAYILGLKPFYDLELAVDPRVLVPRPETEHLVERALALAPDLPGYPTLTVADVGTGSGALALTLARHLPCAVIYATDCQPDALAVARANASALGLTDRVHLVASDLLAALRVRFSLIVANLPYIPRAALPNLAPEISRHEPPSALDGGPDGLVIVRRLLTQLPSALDKGGVALLEIDAAQAAQLEGHAKQLLPGWHIRFHRDYAGYERVAELCPGNHVPASSVHL
jgi:release factor glutamine methyltransferase